MNGIVLIGGGGHCKSVIDVLREENKFQIAGIIDVPEKLGSEVSDIPCIGTDEQIPELAENVLKKMKIINENEKFIITGGVPVNVPGTTNYISVL